MSSFFKNKKWIGKKVGVKTDDSTSKKNNWVKIGTFLIIVESPSKCQKIEEYLGSDYNCIASKGHLREIASLKSIQKTNKQYSIQFSNIPEKESHIEFMRKVIQQYLPENIILATDDDREGEAIAWHICDIFGLPTNTTHRILFHEITQPALLKAIANPGLLNMNLVESQKSRQILDMIVGFKISPYLWKYIYNSKTKSLSAGRCQTASLRLIYDNHKEFEKSGSPEITYKTTATFFSKNLPFVLNHTFITSNDVVEFLNKSHDFSYQLQIGKSKESIKGSPSPFNTSRLLQTASNVLRFSPKQTMTYCQKLYQEGYITYMRTDSTKYSKDFLVKGREYISGKWGEKYIGNLEDLENKDGLNPHEAIRITNIECHGIVSDPLLNSLYKLIWRNTIESCMSDAKYKVLNAIITAPMNYNYSYELEIPVFLGWKIVKPKESSETDKESENITDKQSMGESIFLYLESIVLNHNLITYKKIESTSMIRNKHSYYTEASLIKKLEDLGIGRPSTFSLLVETIQDRGYVKKKSIEGQQLECIDFTLPGIIIPGEKTEILQNKTMKKWGNENNKLIIESIGILAIEFLIQYFSELFSYEYTHKMEEELDKFLIHGENPYQICDHCSKLIKDLTQKMNKIEKRKYNIGEYELVFQSFGPVLRRTRENGIIEYKSIKKEVIIDLEKLQRNEYTLDDLIEIKNEILGTWKDETVLLKTGQYGVFIEWGDFKKSIKTLEKPTNEIKLEDVIPFLENFGTSSSSESDEESLKRPPINSTNMLRVIDDHISIRKGKFGPYIFYKTEHMIKPEFFPLKGCKQYNTMEMEELKSWIKKKYNIPN